MENLTPEQLLLPKIRQTLKELQFVERYGGGHMVRTIGVGIPDEELMKNIRERWRVLYGYFGMGKIPPYEDVQPDFIVDETPHGQRHGFSDPAQLRGHPDDLLGSR